MRYAPLYVKTDNSLLKSMIKIDSYVSYAKELGYKALAIADDTMYGVMDFYIACKHSNIKPIIGLELKLNNNKVVLYCMDNKGYRNLNKLYTLSTERELDLNDLEKYHDSLICILPYSSSELYFTLNKIYKYIFQGYVSNKFLDRNCIYFNEVLYLEKDDYKYYKYLNAIRTSKLVENVPIEKNKYFNVEDFDKLIKDDINNFELIYSLCNLELQFNQDLLVRYDNEDSILTLKKMCIDGMKKRFGASVPRVYLDRLKYELSVINEMGFSNYFLVVQDYVKYAKEHNILVGPGRGSAASSLVAYVLFITEIDPIKNNLLFERFLNKERITMPDIDVDFEFDKREEVIKYCIDKYGIKKVAPIITFNTFGSKQVIRDVAKALDINLKTIDRLTSIIDSNKSLKDNYPNIKDFLSFNDLNNLYKVCLKLEGLKKHTSIHAAGIVMCKDEIDEYIPLEYRDNYYVTAYSMEHLEKIGLLKMDFLALRNLSLINDIIKEANIKLENIPLNDPSTYKTFSRGNTLGIFQFESNGMINFIKKLKPDCFEDIVATLALFRPGPMNNIDSYIKRKQKLEKIDYIHPVLEPILKDTYGIIVYQEQIMMIAKILASYSYGEADVLRRAMSKKKEEVMQEEREKFIERSIKNGYDAHVVTKIFDMIFKFAKYGFNRAHSVAYAMVSYQMAYLKTHYPKYFMKEMLSISIGSSITTKKYIYESMLFDVNILPPDINCSYEKYVLENNSIRAPFSIIKNIGKEVIKKIIHERNKKRFIDIFDFASRVQVEKNTMLNLNDAGCFLSLGINKNTLESNCDIIMNYSLISSIEDDSIKPIINDKDEFNKFKLSEKEYNVFGFYLSNNPITNYKIENNLMISLDEIEAYFDKVVDLVVYVENVKEITTKQNEKMCFLTCCDEMSKIEAVIFPKTYKETQVKKSDFIKVRAKVEKRYNEYQLVIQKVIQLKDH